MLRICCNYFQVFSGVFATVLDTCFKYFICLQTYKVLYLDVLKVDRVLHLPSRFLLSHLGVSSSHYVALHPYQTAEGAQRGPAKGVSWGQANGTR
jgi:hypothetical protein